jgi:hypothetical protein
LIVGAFYAFAIITLPFLGLSIDATPDLSAKSQILLGMFLAGGFLLFFTALIFSKNFSLIRPERPLERWTQNQAFLVLAGFGLVSVSLLFINQIFLGRALASAGTVTPGPVTAATFSIDTATAEESLFVPAAILVFLVLAYVAKTGKLLAAVGSMIGTAAVFTLFHTYVYATSQNALAFVFISRLVLTGVLLGSIVLAKDRKSAATAGSFMIHVTWDLLH